MKDIEFFELPIDKIVKEIKDNPDNGKFLEELLESELKKGSK